MRLRRPQSLSVFFTGPGQVELREERLSRPGRREVLVESRCSLVSTGTERTCLQRDFAPGSHWDEWVAYPFRPGYSLVGVREDGARVCVHASHAQRAVVPDDQLIPVPDAVSDEDASWFALAGIARLGIGAARILPGEPVVVLGAGVLGQLVAQLARRAGAGEVIVIARSARRLEVARTHGATQTIAAAADGAREQVLALTGGEGAATVIDATGSEPVFTDALKLARRHGTVVLLGDAGYPAEQRLSAELLLNGLTVTGAHFGLAEIAEHRRMAQEFFAAVEDGSVVVADLITQRVQPREVPAMYASLAQPDADRLGVLIEWGGV